MAKVSWCVCGGMVIRGAGISAGECGWLRMEAGVCRGGLFWFRSWRFGRNAVVAGLLARQLGRMGFAVSFR